MNKSVACLKLSSWLRAKDKKRLALISSLILAFLCLVFFLTSAVFRFASLYPNMDRYYGPELSGQGVIEYYRSLDSPEIIARWFEDAQWEGDLSRMSWGSTVNLGVIKLTRNVIILQDKQITVVQVATGVQSPFR